MNEPSITTHKPNGVIIELPQFMHIDYNVIASSYASENIHNKRNRKQLWLDNLIYDFFSLVCDSPDTKTFLNYLNYFDFQTTIKDFNIDEQQLASYIKMVKKAYMGTFLDFVSLGYIVNGKFAFCYVQRVGFSCALVPDENTTIIERLL
jgi:hypothetical protein